MKNNLEIFENDEFGKIRVMDIDGEPWFVGKDVADALGYQNGSRDINRHVEEEDRMKDMVFDGNQGKETILINESGLYSLILSSKLPSAKKFKRWVTGEVLPSIRKHGGYIQGQEELSDEELLAKALLVANSKIEERDRMIAEQNKVIETQKPLVEFADKVSKASNTIDMNEMAKLLNKENIKIGRNRLFEFLRENSILMKNNNPYQQYIDQGYFKLVEVVKNTPYGQYTFPKTVVTGKGQIWITEKLRHEYAQG